MDKKKQIIEEMAKVLDGDCGECYTCKYFEHKGTNCTYLLGAEYLYNAGYRKIHENAVVLTNDEFWKLSNKFSKKELDEIVEYHKNKTRKETAGKFAERLKEYVIDDFSEYDYGYLCMKIDGICKEITEGKI